MKKIKLFTAALLTLAIAAGCAQKGGSNTDSTSLPNESGAKNDLVEISIGYFDAQEALANQDNDPLYKALEEKTGVRLVPKELTSSDYHEKVQLWATNGQLPDIFVGDFIGLGQSTFFDWVDQGVIKALPDDLSKYPHLDKYLQSDRAQEALQDGKQYIIPRESYNEIEYSVLDRNICYRWDLAQEAGITKEPESWDEFRDMLKAIMEKDPENKNIGGMNQVGVKTLAGVMYPYGEILEKKWILNDEGVAMPSVFDGDVKSVMNLARDMYKEGTITADVTQAVGNAAKDAFLNGSVAAMSFNGGPMSLYPMGRDWKEIHGSDFLDDVKFAKIWPGVNGNKYYFVDTTAWSEMYISSEVDDEKMDAILRLFDFLVSDEGRLLMYCGIEGEDYTVENGEVKLKDDSLLEDKYPFAMMSGLAVADPAKWDLDFPSAVPKEWREENIKRHEDAVENGVLPNIVDRVMFLSTPKKDEFFFDPHTDFYTIMTGTEPVDEMVDKMMKEYESKGLQEMLDEVNKAAKEKGLID